MADRKKLRIAIVTAFYSEGMGYVENCLPKALVAMGHDVHVVTSTYNVYGNEPLYDKTYREFLGPAQAKAGVKTIDGYTLHRLEASNVGAYVRIKGLVGKIRNLDPDIVHSIEIASLPTFELAAAKPFSRFKLFCETHQNLSILKPYMRNPKGQWLKRAAYRLTRTLPGAMASMAMEKCYAVTPDCGEVAERFYGVPHAKIRHQSLGTDTERFRPAETAAERAARRDFRASLGAGDGDILCVYTGRFSKEKNPLLLADAITILNQDDDRFKALFVGDGIQKKEIESHANTRIVPFMTNAELARHYQAADIAVWPRQESMSMLDAASSGIPVIVSNRIGEPARVEGNGKLYDENSAESLAEVIRSFASPDERKKYGDVGRKRMVDQFSWIRFAKFVEADFLESVNAK